MYVFTISKCVVRRYLEPAVKANSEHGPENGITHNNLAFVFIREFSFKIVNSQSQ